MSPLEIDTMDFGFVASNFVVSGKQNMYKNVIIINQNDQHFVDNNLVDSSERIFRDLNNPIK